MTCRTTSMYVPGDGKFPQSFMNKRYNTVRWHRKLQRQSFQVQKSVLVCPCLNLAACQRQSARARPYHSQCGFYVRSTCSSVIRGRRNRSANSVLWTLGQGWFRRLVNIFNFIAYYYLLDMFFLSIRTNRYSTGKVSTSTRTLRQRQDPVHAPIVTQQKAQNQQRSTKHCSLQNPNWLAFVLGETCSVRRNPSF